MIETPQLVQTEAQQSAIIHVTIPREEIREVMGPGISEVLATLEAQGITPAGPWYTRHLRMEPEIFDFEIGVPVTQPVTPAGRVVPGMLPAASVARTVYHGSYEELGDGWGQFDAWIEAEGHTLEGSLWEQYLTGPETSPDPASWRTELSRPLA